VVTVGLAVLQCSTTSYTLYHGSKTERKVITLSPSLSHDELELLQHDGSDSDVHTKLDKLYCTIQTVGRHNR
jgi:hypothetical protein